jgi:hypothetical protein
MPRRTLLAMRGTEEILDEIERASGAASPSDVLMLCRYYRAAVSTINAQREVIAEHARTIGDLRKKKS